jgi:hypothetical protein
MAIEITQPSLIVVEGWDEKAFEQVRSFLRQISS